MPIAPPDLASRCETALIQPHWPCTQTTLRSSWRWGALGSLAIHSFLLTLLASITLVKEPPPPPALDTRAELHLVAGNDLTSGTVMESITLEFPLPQEMNANHLAEDVGSQDAVKAEKWDKMFPDGLKHDFGKVPSSMPAKHAFRVVNTGNVPLRIISLRAS